MKLRLLALTALILVPLSSAQADGATDNMDLRGLRDSQEHALEPAPPAKAPSTGELASKKTFDKRLPPVLPGEVVTDSSGKKMRVWSTSGPVPVSEAPEPWKKKDEVVVGESGIGVIVDKRD